MKYVNEWNKNLAKCYYNLPFYKQCNNSKKTFFNNNIIKSFNVFYVKSMTQKYLQNTQFFASNHIFPTTGPLNPHTKVNKLCVRYISLYTQKYLRMNLISRIIFSWKFTNEYAHTEMPLRNLLWGSFFSWQGTGTFAAPWNKLKNSKLGIGHHGWLGPEFHFGGCV